MRNYAKLDNPKVLNVLFHPNNFELPGPTNSSDIDVIVDEGISIGCRFFAVAEDKPTILYFHGNGETVSDYNEIAPFYNSKELNLCVATYRGYGRSTGTPSVESMLSDSRIILKSVTSTISEKGFNGPIIVMGRSLGSAVTIDLATYHGDEIKGLIIESGFADTLPLLNTIGLDTASIDLKEEECFGNREKIETITLPTLILHGSADSLIPVSQGERLQIFCGARKKKFYMIPGADHNTTISAGGDNYFTTIKDFIDDVTGVEVWKKREKYRDKRKK